MTKTCHLLVQQFRPLAGDLALDVMVGVLTALEYSHRIGIVHRDIKPANVMLTPTGDVKVMDFGIARALADASSAMTQTQAVMGTAQYISPEQACGEQVDARSDLYSVGCLLFELLTGRPPFVADSPVAVVYQHVREPAPAPSALVSGIPEPVDRIVLHSLGKGREDRYQRTAEFRADVEAARGGRQVKALAGVGDGTRATAPIGGVLLGAEEPGSGSQWPFGDDYNQYSRRAQGDLVRQSHSRRGAIVAAMVLVIMAEVGFLVLKLVGS